MQRAHAALGVGIALVAFALYARTAAPTITWLNGGTDSAELVTASYTLGIAHPPGYPLYVLLGKAWSLLPLDGDVAYRYNLFSALCGALAAALVALLTLHLCRRSQTRPGDPATSGAQDRASLLAAAVAGLSLTAAPAFWAQATVAEVYTLHALLLTVALGLLLAWSARQAASGRVGLLALASLSVGLALGNHLTTVFLVPLGLAYTGAVGWRTVSVRGWLIVVLAFLLGLVVYAYLPLRAAHDPVANWGDPSTPERFLQHITGAEYRGYLLGRPLGQVLLRVPVVARLLVEQFTWPGIVLLCLGIWDAWERLRREAALLLGIALANVLFALVYNAEGSQVYLLPAYVVSAMFIGLGVAWLWRLVAREAPGRWRGPALATLALATLLMPLGRAATAYGDVDASNDYEALEYAWAALQAAPSAEPLYPSSDEETFPLWYAQEVLDVRPDVPIVNLRLLRLAWYREHLTRRYPGYTPPLASGP